MKKNTNKHFDFEDKILLILSAIFFILFSIALSLGFSIYPEGKFNIYYLCMVLSFAVFFLFSVLSFCVKKNNERKNKGKQEENIDDNLENIE